MGLFRIVTRVIGLSQLVLAVLYFTWPAGFIAWQGLTPPAADIGYPLAMLAARFFVYGVGMFLIAERPQDYRPWAWGMVAIQLLDLLAGLVYVALGVVAADAAAIPMVNAALFAAALALVLNRLPARAPALA